MKARGQSFQAHPGHVPVTIATGTLEQIHLSRHAFNIGGAQFGEQRMIAASSSGKGRFKGSRFIGHSTVIMGQRLIRGFPADRTWYRAGMVGENRIIAFGASGNVDHAQNELAHGADAGVGETQPFEDGLNEPATDAETSGDWEQAWVAAEDEGVDESTPRGWIAPTLAGLFTVAWTGLFFHALSPRLAAGVPLADMPSLVAQWCVPVLMIGLGWLLVLRHSAREGKRFGDVARTLSVESERLEQRLTTVNRELSLAREFVAAQSRDLESLGRVAGERLSQHAGRLQQLVQENGARVETISTVSSAALDNMEKLRGQLPVIASSAKDVTNNIGNAGRAAHAQLEDMINGFNRLNEMGTASERQVGNVRAAFENAFQQFSTQCADMEHIAGERFAALAQNSEDFRTELGRHEVDALASVRNRADALQHEIAQVRSQLDSHEAESLTSLRARLGALRDESDVVSRALHDAEARATESLRNALAMLAQEQASTGEAIAVSHEQAMGALTQRVAALSAEADGATQAIERAQLAAIDALAARLGSLETEALRVEDALAQRADQFAIEAEERQSRQVEQERHAIARIEHMLGELDGVIAERLERHRQQAEILTERASTVTRELEQYDARLRSITTQTGETESRLLTSLETMLTNLTSARATLSSTDGDVSKLTDDSVRLLELIQASAKHAHAALPEALALSEDRLNRLETSVGSLLTLLQQSSDNHQLLTGEIDASNDKLKGLISILADAQFGISSRARDHQAMLGGLQDQLVEIETLNDRTAEKSSTALFAAIENLTSSLSSAVASIEADAANRIDSIARTLGDESGSAIDKVMRGKVAEISGQLEQAVAHASGVTREATMQLRDQLSKVDELVGNLENRVSHARQRAEEQVDNDFARRVALITESLNSNAIDIAKALSADVADTAWSAYLRGDRGIFTRRAVSLIDASETKAIQQIYERDDGFREHVNRYVHDFEAILRQILSTRDGNALGVTLLSSDMGKLYVVLAQGIERLRN